MRMRDYLIPFRTHRGEFAAFADSSGRQTVCRHSAVNTPRVWWCLVRDWCLIIQTPDTKFSFRAHACSRRYQTAFLVFLFVFCAKKKCEGSSICALANWSFGNLLSDDTIIVCVWHNTGLSCWQMCLPSPPSSPTLYSTPIYFGSQSGRRFSQCLPSVSPRKPISDLHCFTWLYHAVMI